MLEKMSHRKEENGRKMRRCLGKTEPDEGAWYYTTHKSGNIKGGRYMLSLVSI
jgi:hypothetical protein